MKQRVFIALLITAILLSLTGCSGGATPDSASPDSATPDQTSAIRHHLVKSVKSYQKDVNTGKWELQNTVSVTYLNAYPTLIETVYTDKETKPAKTTCRYTFDGELPKTCVETDSSSTGKKTVAYQNGRVYDVSNETGMAGNYTKMYYQYGNDDDYFTMVLQETHETASGDNPAATNEEVDSVSVTTENGLLKKTVNTGMYANWANGEKKEWLRFRGVYTADYDSDGIVSVMTGDFGKDGTSVENRFAVTREDGRITEVVVQIPDEGDSLLDLTKYEFEYNDTEISPARYSLMMNYFIVGNQSNYYHYNWY